MDFAIGSSEAFGWGALTRLGPLTALAFSVLGLGMVALAWSADARPGAVRIKIELDKPVVVEKRFLLTPGEGFAIAERDVEQAEVGGSPRHLSDIVLGVVRDGQLLRVDVPEADAIEPGDRLLYVRSVESKA